MFALYNRVAAGNTAFGERAVRYASSHMEWLTDFKAMRLSAVMDCRSLQMKENNNKNSAINWKRENKVMRAKHVRIQDLDGK